MLLVPQQPSEGHCEEKWMSNNATPNRDYFKSLLCYYSCTEVSTNITMLLGTYLYFARDLTYSLLVL